MNFLVFMSFTINYFCLQLIVDFLVIFISWIVVFKSRDWHQIQLTNKCEIRCFCHLNKQLPIFFFFCEILY